MSPSAADPSGSWKRKAAVGTVLLGGAAGGFAAWWIHGSPGGRDTLAPTGMAITAPSAGATVSGSSVTVSATCTDNIGVVGVQFTLNGANLNTEVTSPVGGSYSTTWDSAASGDGTYTLSAVCRDAAGNVNANDPSESITVSSGFGGGPPVANEWVNLTAGASPSRSATPVAYDSTHAYSSLNAAYLAASCGDRVAVEAGTYLGNAGQVINSDTNKAGCSSNVVITAAPSASVTLGGPPFNTHSGPCLSGGNNNIDICGSHLTLENMSSGESFFIHAAADHDVLDTMQFLIGNLFPSASNLTIQNSTFGDPANAYGDDGIHFQTEGGCTVNGTTCLQPSNITIQDNLFTHLVLKNAGDHTDSIQGLAGANVTVQRNKFVNDDDGIIVGCEFGNNGCTGWLIQNNFFGAVNDPNVITANTPLPTNSLVIRFNSFAGGGFNVGPVTLDSNLIPSMSSFACTTLTTTYPGTVTHNIFLNGSAQCGGTNTVLGAAVTFGYMNSSTADLHCGSCTVEAALGNTSSFPTDDFDKATRPNPPAAGADQP